MELRVREAYNSHSDKLCAWFIVFVHLKDCLEKDQQTIKFLSATLSAGCRVYLQLF